MTGPDRTDRRQRVGVSGTAAWHRALLALLLVGASALAGGCGSSAEQAVASEGDPQFGGTMTIGMDQQPNCLNNRHVCGGMAATSMVTSPLFEAYIGTNSDGTSFPIMATKVPTTDNGGVKALPDGRMRVTVDIDPRAKWSDDVPVTCADQVFTWKTIMDEDNLISSRQGWDKVVSIECPSERRIVWTFSETYAPYLRVIGGPPMPKHEMEGKDFNSYLNDQIRVSNGPFVFSHWKRSVEIVLTRNENYWRAPKGDLPRLDTLRYVFIPDTNTLKIQLRTGEVDWISPPPDTSLAQELEGFPRAGYQAEPGIFWEQLAFNNAKFPTDDPAVRKALAYGVDREQIVSVVLRGQVEQLDSTLLPSLKEYYVPAWSTYEYSPEKVEEVLTAAGWTRDGQYWEKGGKPLVVLFKSTAGNALRMKVAQVLQQSYKQLGIKMDIQLEAPEVFFGQSTVQGAYNIGLWAWGSDAEPSQVSLFSCEEIPSKANDYAGNNNYRYCNEEVTKLLKQADVTPDREERARLVRRIQELMAKDVPMLPLFQRPQTVAYDNSVGGIQNQPLSGDFWNVHDWWVAQ